MADNIFRMLQRLHFSTNGCRCIQLMSELADYAWDANIVWFILTLMSAIDHT